MTHKIFRPTAIAISMLAGTALCGSGLALAQDAMPGADAGMMTTNKSMAKDEAAFFQNATRSGMTEIAVAKVAEIGRPHLYTPVTIAHLVFTRRLNKQNYHSTHNTSRMSTDT